MGPHCLALQELGRYNCKFKHHCYVSNDVLMYPNGWVGPAAWQEGPKRGRYRASAVLPTASSHPIPGEEIPMNRRLRAGALVCAIALMFAALSRGQETSTPVASAPSSSLTPETSSSTVPHLIKFSGVVNPQITQITQIRQAEDRKEAQPVWANPKAGCRRAMTFEGGHNHVSVLALSLALPVFHLCNLRNLRTVLVMMFSRRRSNPNFAVPFEDGRGNTGHEPGRESRHGGIWVFAGQ